MCFAHHATAAKHKNYYRVLQFLQQVVDRPLRRVLPTVRRAEPEVFHAEADRVSADIK